MRRPSTACDPGAAASTRLAISRTVEAINAPTFVFCCTLDMHGRQGSEHRREQEFRRFDEAANHAHFFATAPIVDRPHSLNGPRLNGFAGLGDSLRLATREPVLAGQRQEN
jgi:hypothetical protein